MKKILITSRSFGQLSKKPIEILEKAGFQLCFYNKKYDENEFCEIINDCQALIIGAHPLTERALQCAKKLEIVVKHGAGLDNIDLNLCKKYSIAVDNVPAVNSNAVADLTFSLILDVARKTSYASATVKKGEWNRVTGVDVYNKTLGLVGFGAIAQNVAKRAVGFSMEVMAYDPFITDVSSELSNIVSLAKLDDVLKESDFLSVHVPLNNSTHNLIDINELSIMKQGAFLINTSRGGIVNESALYNALVSGHLAGAGLDVIESEPISLDNPLLGLDNVIITPHIGMYSFEAINAVSIIAATKVVEHQCNK